MNKEYKYAIGALILGVLLTVGVQAASNQHRDSRNEDYRMMGSNDMHKSMMHDSMDSMTSSLKGKTGDEFDKAFLSEMITHHQGAIEMANMALKNANHQEIKDLANAIVSAQTTEINQMTQWQQTWYK